MEVPRRTILAVLSADADCVRRIWRLYGEREALVLLLASDPDDLLRVVVPLTRIWKRAGSDLVAVLIDLTAPPSAAGHRERGSWTAKEDPADTEVAAKTVIELLAGAGIGSAVPLIVVSADHSLRARLDVAGMATPTFLSPSDDDVTWRQALDALLTPQHTPSQEVPRRTQRQKKPAAPPPTAIPLHDGLWFEPAACELLHRGHHVPLTARESSLLAILLRTPCTYHHASDLARRLTPPGSYPVDAHSIEQTVSTLRRKLGERKGQPQLLRVRRGVGYGLFPRFPCQPMGSTASDTRVKAGEFSRERYRET